VARVPTTQATIEPVVKQRPHLWNSLTQPSFDTVRSRPARVRCEMGWSSSSDNASCMPPCSTQYFEPGLGLPIRGKQDQGSSNNHTNPYRSTGRQGSNPSTGASRVLQLETGTQPGSTSRGHQPQAPMSTIPTYVALATQSTFSAVLVPQCDQRLHTIMEQLNNNSAHKAHTGMDARVVPRWYAILAQLVDRFAQDPGWLPHYVDPASFAVVPH
jgi:hypothetical protein